MRKLYCLLAAITFVLIGIAPAHAQLKPSSQSALARKVLAEQKYYMFDRVKTMCQEWPGCEEWAQKRHKENPSFYIIDAEVEYYVVKTEYDRVWHYNLYVETLEHLTFQTYVFTAQEDQFHTVPVKFKKFPGHPFTDMPSMHAKYEIEHWPSNPPKNSHLCKRWPSAMAAIWRHLRVAIEQQRVWWDKNGNPRWERRLDFTYKAGPFHARQEVSIIARQQKLGAAFQFLKAKGAHSILKRADMLPEFSFVKIYPH